MDECDEDSIRLAVVEFEELGYYAVSKGIKLAICFASRHYPNITMKHYQALNLDEQRGHQEDIEKFVKGRLHGVGDLHLELSSRISCRSSGVFSWAALVVQIVNRNMDRGATRSQLIRDLKAVPSGIEQLLKSILTDGSKSLLPTLLWVLFSAKPLSPSELYNEIMFCADRKEFEELNPAETRRSRCVSSSWSRPKVSSKSRGA